MAAAHCQYQYTQLATIKEGRLTHVGESTSRQPHSTTSHQHSAHDEEIRMRFRHLLSDLLNKGKNNERCDGMTDECRYDPNESAEDDENAIQTHALDARGDRLGNGMQETGRVDSFTERQTTSSQDDDSPEEVVKILFSEDTSAKEEDDGDDSYNTHVAKDGF
jgi:hypothetical protein